ncbi:MAG: c-type cytochrome [Nitrospirota bacterium]|nr:c-type cytochrome [Nitrospirota bacterium]
MKTGIKDLPRCCFLSGLLLISLSFTIAIAADNTKNPFAGNAEAIKAGEKLFDANCTDCHAGDATGIAGPNLTDDQWTYGGTDADVFQTISKGRKGGMPGWSGNLKDDEIWRIISYLRTLATKK